MLKEEIGIPEGLEASMERGRVSFKGPKGEISRIFKHPRVRIGLESGKITIASDIERKKTRAIIGTWRAHLSNMITGVTKGWKGEARLVYSHFPVKLKQEGNRLVIGNFLGERNPRSVPVPDDLKVEVKGSDVIVSGSDKERVGQLCARIEQIAKVRGYDKRIFQDGIYITKKPYPEGEDEGKE